jgi:CheY-like chemotaxis protein
MAITTAHAPSTRPIPSQPPVVLLVEDEIIILVVIAGYLRGCGYQVIEAQDADEAVALLEADHPVDALFSDVRMPGEMDGLGLARWARRHRPEVPVLLTSGFVKDAMIADALCADGSMLDKPYDAQEMEGRIRHMLGARDLDGGLLEPRDIGPLVF